MKFRYHQWIPWSNKHKATHQYFHSRGYYFVPERLRDMCVIDKIWPRQSTRYHRKPIDRHPYCYITCAFVYVSCLFTICLQNFHPWCIWYICCSSQYCGFRDLNTKISMFVMRGCVIAENIIPPMNSLTPKTYC